MSDEKFFIYLISGEVDEKDVKILKEYEKKKEYVVQYLRKNLDKLRKFDEMPTPVGVKCKDEVGMIDMLQFVSCDEKSGDKSESEMIKMCKKLSEIDPDKNYVFCKIRNGIQISGYRTITSCSKRVYFAINDPDILNFEYSTECLEFIIDNYHKILSLK